MTMPEYGEIIGHAEEDPNGPPGVPRGGVQDLPHFFPLSKTDYNGAGPAPYPQNQSTPNPLDEAFYAVGPEG